MLDFNNSQSKIVNIDREGKALQRCNLSARPMPEDGQGHVLSHMLLPSRSSFGYKAINLLSWCEAPIRVKQAKSSAPVGHMSVLSIRCFVLIRKHRFCVNGFNERFRLVSGCGAHLLTSLLPLNHNFGAISGGGRLSI